MPPSATGSRGGLRRAFGAKSIAQSSPGSVRKRRKGATLDETVGELVLDLNEQAIQEIVDLCRADPRNIANLLALARGDALITMQAEDDAL